MANKFMRHDGIPLKKMNLPLEHIKNTLRYQNKMSVYDRLAMPHLINFNRSDEH